MARVRGPILKTMTLPFESRRVFSGMKSDLIKEAVPYLEGALLEIILKEEQIVSHVEKDSSLIFISCR